MIRVFFTFVIIAQFSFSQEIEVKVKTDSLNYQIGDHINLEYNFKHQSGIELFFPSLKDSLKKLEVIDIKKPEIKKENGNVNSRFQFVVIGFDSGNVTIPSFLIPYKTNDDTTFNFIRTDSLIITIHTIAVDTSKEIRDVKNPITVPYDYLVLLYWILGALVVLAIIYFIYKKFFTKKKIREEKKIFIPNWLRALNLLTELSAQQLWQKGEVKEYHSQITGIIRNYFEEEFQIKALEKTSFEIIEDLRNVSRARTILIVTEEFLSNADMVKFAKFIPMPQVNEEMMKQAINIVELSRSIAKDADNV